MDPPTCEARGGLTARCTKDPSAKSRLRSWRTWRAGGRVQDSFKKVSDPDPDKECVPLNVAKVQHVGIGGVGSIHWVQLTGGVGG